jgi:hypothetical protein
MDVHVKRLSPFFVADVGEIGEGRLMGGIVNEDIDAAQLAYRSVHDLAAVVRGPKVSFDQHRLSSFPLGKVRGFLGILSFIEIGDQDIGALAGECDGDGSTYSAVSARDDGPLASQPAGALVARLTMIGRGSIFAVEPGIGWVWLGYGGLG